MASTKAFWLISTSAVTTHKALVHFDRNGFAYAVDRTNGKVLLAKPFAHVNWAEDINLETGLPIEKADKRTKQGTNVKDICPAAMGGKDQQPVIVFSTHETLLCANE